MAPKTTSFLYIFYKLWHDFWFLHDLELINLCLMFFDWKDLYLVPLQFAWQDLWTELFFEFDAGHGYDKSMPYMFGIIMCFRKFKFIVVSYFRCYVLVLFRFVVSIQRNCKKTKLRNGEMTLSGHHIYLTRICAISKCAIAKCAFFNLTLLV